mmetsp:Transcript_29538/g.53481  ORF Transcript_29538/g.53481 Transcript_29538/m.53481 type:complete len:219 (+) Transcript_29538:1129-1785(+)
MVDHVVNQAKQPFTSSQAPADSGSSALPPTFPSLSAPTRLIDAYCGGGLFCLAASSHFEQCAGIEISALNVASAAANAERNAIQNCAFVEGTAEDIFATVKKKQNQEKKQQQQGSGGGGVSGGGGGGGEDKGLFETRATCVLIDPPRKGCSEEFLNQLLSFAPSRVVYVSCDPSTQARDAATLLASENPKYVITDCTLFDLFPQTRHIENVLTFERRD